MNPRERILCFRAISVLAVLHFMYLHSAYRSEQPALVAGAGTVLLEQRYAVIGGARHLLSDKNDSETDDNCTSLRHLQYYNNSCDFVRQECTNKRVLIDYLSFTLCDCSNFKPLAYILLVLWLFYLISLLATTARNFFVPPLDVLSEKLKLSPSIAGITLLALGNGAPDIFTAVAALNNQNDLALLLSGLIGASVFISTVVLGTIILLTSVTKDSIDRLDFIRDVIAYVLVVALIIGICFDGEIHLYEAILFLVFYLGYIGVVVILGYMRQWWINRKRHTGSFFIKNAAYSSVVDQASNGNSVMNNTQEALKQSSQADYHVVLAGLTWPRGEHVAVKIQWFVEWPMSLLRWLSIPPCYHGGHWSQWHRWFAVISPVPMMLLLVVVSKSYWVGFTIELGGTFPLFVLLLMIGLLLSVALFFLLRSAQPHWALQIVLGVAAFSMSIAWLYLLANEVVSLLQAFGLFLGVDTAIFGLTVLAIGNSVGDWVADTTVAMAGKPGMGVAACYGSPLLNDVLGLSISLLVTIAAQGGQPFLFNIHQSSFDGVKLSWIFLAISLVSTLTVFAVSRFSPPRWYGVSLIYLYIVFMTFSVLNEANIVPMHFSSS